jgi:uncharacterized protein YbaA (DUF1428 family)
VAQYVDGFVIAIPKKNLARYKKDALMGRKTWLKHGALDYRECVADDLNTPYGTPFSKLVALKPNETIIFAWIVYKSKAARERINKKVMKDMQEHSQRDLRCRSKSDVCRLLASKHS